MIKITRMTGPLGFRRRRAGTGKGCQDIQVTYTFERFSKFKFILHGYTYKIQTLSLKINI